MQAPPRQRSEAQGVAQRAQGFRVSVAPHEARVHIAQRRIAGDRRELPVQARGIGVLAELRADLAGATEAQELDLVAARQQRIQRAEVMQQARRGLATDAGDTGNVVDGITAQGEVIGHLVRVDAVTCLHARRRPALAAREIPLAVVALQQLGYKPAEAQRMAKQAFAEGDVAEAIIRKALQSALR